MERSAIQTRAERTAEHGRRARAQFSLRFLRSTDSRLLQLVLAAWRREAQAKRVGASWDKSKKVWFSSNRHSTFMN